MTQYLSPQVTVRQPNCGINWSLYDDTSHLSDVLASNYLGALQTLGAIFTSQDTFYINYQGGAGLFVPSFSGNVITLTPFNLLSVSVPITAAQFNGMYAAPVKLLDAPGANRMIVVSKMDLVLTYGSSAFASGGVVAAQYDSTVHGGGVLATNSEAAADFFVTASTVFQFGGSSGNTVGALPFSTCANKGLYLSNATGAFTTGDSTLVAKLFFNVIATA